MKKIYILLSSVFVTGAAIAQAPYAVTYDFNPEHRYASGAITTIDGRAHNSNQDRTVYYSEDFDAGFGIWTDAIQTGSAGFKLTNVGHDNGSGNSFIIPTLGTDTPTQWIILDSDADGTGYTDAENATMTSSVIDLAAAGVNIAGGDFVAFEFDQFFAEWDQVFQSGAGSEDHLFLGVSVDGSTWTETEISNGVGRDARPNPESVSWDISTEIDGFENSVQFRFRWEGAWNYGWQIDNIEIVDIAANDVQIVDTWRTYSPGWGLVFSQVPQAHATEFQIAAIVKNVGHFDATNVDFDWEIFDPAMTSVASGTSTAALSLTNAMFDTILINTGYVPTTLGNYTIEWTAVSTEGETAGQEGDNFVSDAHFELTEYTYAADYNDGAVEEVGNWPLAVGIAHFGNMVEFQVADVVTGIYVQLTSHPEIVGELINYSVYTFTSGGAQWDFWEDGIDYEITSADLGQTIFIPIPGGFDVDVNDVYLFNAVHYGSSTMPIFARQGDVKIGNAQGIDDADAGRGFFDRKAPIVRPRVNAGEVGIEETVEADKFSIYPNPANDVININLNLTNSENTVINVVDITGKVVKTNVIGSVDGETKVSISLEELNAGVYFIELINEEGKQVKKFVKK